MKYFQNYIKHFLKLDLNAGDHQMLPYDTCWHMTTFAIHLEVYQYKRLIYGISSTFKIFQKKIELAIPICVESKHISDDTLI